MTCAECGRPIHPKQWEHDQPYDPFTLLRHEPRLGDVMTVSARTVETNTADALAEFFANVGDTDNAEHWVKRLEGSFPSPLVDVRVWPAQHEEKPRVMLVFEDGSVLHLTVTQVKEPNQ